MRWILIRHGMTAGNLEGRYIGCRTDEPLCPEGVQGISRRSYPSVSRVFCSPMLRCLETARLIYPEISLQPIDDFRECDFGIFENLSYSQLNGRADYQTWIDSGGEMPFPAGESRADFAARCTAAFDALRKNDYQQDCALIIHGGTIMAIMEKYARPKGNYFDFQVRNGEGFILHTEGTYEKF